MTSEHVWGEWIQQYVPRTTNKHDFADIRVPAPGKDHRAAVKIRAGDPINAQVGVVCAECNNGWMSELQNRAKTYLIPLLNGEKTLIVEPAQRAIAAWVAMATMTGEHIPRNESITVPQAERDWLMQHYLPPPATWRIWIGRCPGPWIGRQWVRTTCPILPAEQLPDRLAAHDRLPNTQATVFKIGKLYVATLTCPFPEIPAGWDWRTAPRAQTRLQQIWPVVGHFFVWPAADMTDRDASSFATAWKRYSDHVAGLYGFR